MKLKKGVDITGLQPELVLGLIIAECVYRTVANVDLMVTAVKDGKHMTGSLHYKGLAADLRSKDVPEAVLPALVSTLQSSLGDQFDVVFEANHIHIEFDPK